MHVHLSCLDGHRAHLGYTLDTRCHGVRSHENPWSWNHPTRRSALARPSNWRNVEECVQESRKYCINDKVTIYFSTLWDTYSMDVRHTTCPWWLTRKRNVIGGTS